MGFTRTVTLNQCRWCEDVAGHLGAGADEQMKQLILAVL